MIGVVGRSGSGKSILTELIQRLYVPDSAPVLLDGTDLAMACPTWLRRQVGVLLQENVLFNRMVGDSIALVDPALYMDRVVEAAKLAGAHEFIQELLEGHELVLGERDANQERLAQDLVAARLDVARLRAIPKSLPENITLSSGPSQLPSS